MPAGSLPVTAGVICQNVATAAAVARWAARGEPLLTRVVTVTGSGVGRPCNVRAPIGTPLAALIAAAGGYRGTPLRLIAGGNMTGRALPADEVGLTKAMNCVFVATRDDIGSRLDAVELPCIRCGDCAERVPCRTAAAATAPGGARRRSRRRCGNSACATASIAASATTSARARFRSPIVFATRGGA